MSLTDLKCIHKKTLTSVLHKERCENRRQEKNGRTENRECRRRASLFQEELWQTLAERWEDSHKTRMCSQCEQKFNHFPLERKGIKCTTTLWMLKNTLTTYKPLGSVCQLCLACVERWQWSEEAKVILLTRIKTALEWVWPFGTSTSPKYQNIYGNRGDTGTSLPFIYLNEMH